MAKSRLQFDASESIPGNAPGYHSNQHFMNRRCRITIGLSASLVAAAPMLSAQQVLRQLDSVLVKESEGTYLSRIGTMAVGPKGDVFVSDLVEGRIIQIARNGDVVGTISRKGKGPGELTTAGSMTFMGDSLFVFDYNQARISVFQVATRKFLRSFTAPLPPFTQVSAIGSELIAHITEPKTFTSVVVLSPSGTIARREGVSPEFLRQNPKFIQALNQSALTVRGNEVWSASEYSQSLYNWKRGTTVVTQELKIPVVTRRGVDEGVLLKVLQDPEKNATRLYDHSFPIALRFIAPEILALVTMDPKFEPPSASMRNGKLTGQHHVTLVDIKAKRVCPDTRLPIVDDPLPKVDLIGDVLVVVQQASLKNGDAATALRRFRIDPKQCTWIPL